MSEPSCAARTFAQRRYSGNRENHSVLEANGKWCMVRLAIELPTDFADC